MNGNGIRWLIGLVAAPILGVVIGWVHSINERGNRHAEAIAVLQSQVADTRDELKSINRKLDQLLTRGSNGNR
jgi:hypothetical protein